MSAAGETLGNLVVVLKASKETTVIKSSSVRMESSSMEDASVPKVGRESCANGNAYRTKLVLRQRLS